MNFKTICTRTNTKHNTMILFTIWGLNLVLIIKEYTVDAILTVNRSVKTRIRVQNSKIARL
jgi:hypothetical protein